ncbi:lipid IV(A) 3-deoxy-D-manno-octulosonic acid transferase [Helicobacter sp. 13S00477-4]|uniref:lipid IV(A) 3-deoxy-D-manno-octulosonic acid transferase n=1 Tax=Helicobacter sp. 13S00477-4 TaxID=1905759 RepID=UPI000BA6675D|nr:lipid IV(A) 3-deoxy-D-manno-octulosonic acid transferase [Helicobacter sp. 13S00477-4]PAF51239.1 3-deoxy-D-manno-octulosonic acid transferase [Helicobacter sp. 13S00477-4]
MFVVIYYFIFFCVYIISIPLLLVNSLKSKYRQSIPVRFFLKDFSLCIDPHYWFHACSYGEIKSLEPIIMGMPKQPILITTITQTGFELASKTYANHSYIQIKYLPFEIFIPFWKNRLKSLKTLVVTEAELWYSFFFIAKKISATTMLINARISTHSYPKYKKFAWFYKNIFKLVDITLAQEQKDVSRLQTLGAKNIKIFGNLKILSTPKVNTHYPKSSNPTIIAASTHYGEEELILKTFLELKKTIPNIWLIVAPRHPQRFNEVARLIKKIQPTSFTFKIFSQNGFDSNCDILLIDTLGELNNLYPIADIVILGGSFAKIGGHNPLECAFFNTKLISGPHIFNQTALFDSIDGYKIIEQNQLYKTLESYQSLPKTRIKDQKNKLNTLITIITKENEWKKPTNF